MTTFTYHLYPLALQNAQTLDAYATVLRSIADGVAEPATAAQQVLDTYPIVEEKSDE